MAIYDPNIGLNIPEIDYQETFQLPVIDTSELTRSISRAADREEKRFDEIVKAYDEYTAGNRDLLGIRVDNKRQEETYNKVRSIYGTDEKTLQSITVDDLKNPYRLKDMGTRFKQTVKDYRIQDLVKEQAAADKYRSDLEMLKSLDSQMGELAAKDLESYYKRDLLGTSLNIKKYEPIDIASELGKAIKEIPDNIKSEMMTDLEHLGLVYEQKEKRKSELLIGAAIKSKLNDPIFKNNLIARGLYDAQTQMLTPAGQEYFDGLSNEYSKVNTEIDNVKNIPGFDIDGSSGGGTKGSRSSGSSKSTVDNRIFDGSSAADDRGRFYQEYAEKIGLDTYDPGVIEMLKETNLSYFVKDGVVSPEQALMQGKANILKHALENAHIEWFAIKAVRDFGYDGNIDSFIKTIAEGTDPELDQKIGTFLQKVYEQETYDVVDGDGNIVPNVVTDPATGNVTISNLYDVHSGTSITIDHNKVFNNLKKKAKEAYTGWTAGKEKMEEPTPDIIPDSDIANRFKKVESADGTAIINADSSAIGDYHFLWSDWGLRIKDFLQQKGIQPADDATADNIFKTINKYGRFTRYKGDRKWIASWVQNTEAQKEFMHDVIAKDYAPVINNNVIPEFGDFMSDKSDYNYLVHYFGPTNLMKYLRTGKHYIKQDGEWVDNTSVAKKSLQNYSIKNNTNLWNDLVAFFKNKGNNPTSKYKIPNQLPPNGSTSGSGGSDPNPNEDGYFNTD